MFFYGFASFYVQAHTSCELRNSYIIFGAGVIENLTAANGVSLAMRSNWHVQCFKNSTSRLIHTRTGSYDMSTVYLTTNISQ